MIRIVPRYFPVLGFVAVTCVLLERGRSQAVVINEVGAMASDRALRYDAAGRGMMGCDDPWYSVEFVRPPFWQSGPGPFGFGYPSEGTNLQAAVLNKAMTFYLRHEFTLTAGQAASTNPLALELDYDDGFIAYLNGTEIARRNLGPPGAFAYAGQQTFNNHPASGAEVMAVSSGLLRAGLNVLAFQVHNNALSEGGQDAPATAPGARSMRCAATLRTTGPVPAVLVAPGDRAYFFAGLHEPSGGLLDPADFASGGLPIGPDWTAVDYVDTAWGIANGALGFDTAPDYQGQIGTGTNALLLPMRGTRVSVYGRREFTLTQAQFDGITTLSLGTDWDDGYVLFLNGYEIDRQNLATAPGTLVPWDASAGNHSAVRDNGNAPATLTYFNINVQKSQLRVGKNILAAQLHNAGTGSSDLLLDVQFSAAGAAPLTLVTKNSPWRYRIPAAEFASPGVLPVSYGPDFHDWVELRNPGPAAVSLAGWTLTDDPQQPARWTFPAGTIIPANGYLVVACSGRNVTNPPLGGLLHTNFSLKASGEFLSLRHPQGGTVSELTAVPDQDYFHTWGIDPATGTYGFLSRATPGRANGSSFTAARVLDPAADRETGYYSRPFTVALSCLTPGASIRYTLDGSEPTLTHGASYTAPIDPGLQPPPAGPGAGFAVREVWSNVPYGISNIPARPADVATRVTLLEAPSNVAEGYSQRISGFIHATTTGSYTFYIASDDMGLFRLSSDASPSGKIQRCAINGWTNYREWNRSGETSQVSAPVTLTAGRKYYFEALQSEASGGDNLSIGWTGPGFPEITIIPGNQLSPPDVLPPNLMSSATGASLRFRAFAPGMEPSAVKTRSYAVNFASGYQSMASVFLTGEAGRTFYLPNGALSLSGGNFASGDWVPGNSGADYNFCIMHGSPFERPASFEVVKPGVPGVAFRTTLGARFAGSPWSRPKQTMLGLEDGPWNGGWANKPQMNLNFRDDFGANTLSRNDFIPGSPADEWDSLRLRAGKNDAYNPFIVDEFMRRLYFRLGNHPSPQGFFANLFVNGQWKGHYNLTERPREKFFQEFYGSNHLWDVNYIGSFENGDRVNYNQMMGYFQNHDFSILTNYRTGKTWWDEVNAADYFLINAFAATADWPWNNFVCARERTPGALWRYSMWDAEGAFGGFGGGSDYNTLTDQLLVPENGSRNPAIGNDDVVSRLIFRRFCQSGEFRMLFADRIQRQFFNGGPLAPGPLGALYQEMKGQMEPGLAASSGQGFNDYFWSNWINGGGGRTATFLSQARAAGLWPAVAAPALTPFGGSVAAGTTATLTHGNGSGGIFFTTDGSDPRAEGGAVQGTAYAVPVLVDRPLRIKARVLSDGAWSPLVEADFAPPPPRLLFTEINYNPPGTSDDTEFLEITNTGGSPARLDGAHFTDGIEFTFGPNVTLAAGQSLVLARNAAAFTAAYPSAAYAGVFTGALSNSGETLTLRDLAEAVILTMTYGDGNVLDWPPEADGDGPTLVLKRPGKVPAPDPNLPSQWRRSATPGGQPGVSDSSVFPAVRPEADLDRDGWSALLEYAFGTSDNNASAVPQVGTSRDATGRFVLTVATNPAADDVWIDGLQSPDLTSPNWTVMTRDVNQTWTPQGLVSTFRTLQPVSAVPQLFSRIRITLLP